MLCYAKSDVHVLLNKFVLFMAEHVDTILFDLVDCDKGTGVWSLAGMEKMVAKCDVVLALVSPAFVKSKKCGYTLHTSADLNTPVLPILISPVQSWPPEVVGESEMVPAQSPGALPDVTNGFSPTSSK